jgi:hypothetical protein
MAKQQIKPVIPDPYTMSWNTQPDRSAPVFGSMSTPAIPPAISPVTPAYDNSADTNALQQYIEALYPETARKKEERYKKAAMANAAGNILRSFFDAVGAAKGAPVSPTNNDKYLNQYHQVMQENMQRQDRVNQYMLQETSRRLAQGDQRRYEQDQTQKNWNREDQKTTEGQVYTEKMYDKNKENLDIRDKLKFEQQKEIDKQQAQERRDQGTTDFGEQKQLIGIQGAEQRKTYNDRQVAAEKAKAVLRAQKTDEKIHDIIGDVDGKKVVVARLNEGKINDALIGILNNPESENYPELFNLKYTGNETLSTKIFLLAKFKHLINLADYNMNTGVPTLDPATTKNSLGITLPSQQTLTPTSSTNNDPLGLFK